MSEFSLDVGDLLQFGDDLVASTDGLLDKVQPAVAKGAVKVKATMRADMQASRHFGQVARSISYDITRGQGWVEAAVGPVTSGQTVGDLAHLAYFGGAHGGGGTVRDPQNALDEEADAFESGVAEVLGDVL